MTGFLASGVALAALLAIGALALSIIAIVRDPEPPPPPDVPQAAPQELFVNDADKSLCEVIAPLMKEQQNSHLYGHWRTRFARAFGDDSAIQS